MTVNSKKQEYLATLQINNLTKYDELKKAYIMQVKKQLRLLNVSVDEFINSIKKLNTAYHNLSLSCVEKDCYNIGTTSVCHGMGMSFDIATKTYIKLNKTEKNNSSFDSWLSNRAIKYSKIDINNVIEKCVMHPILVLFPCDDIINMYLTDNELNKNNIEINLWLEGISNLFIKMLSLNLNIDIEKMTKKIYDEYNVFLCNSKKLSFVGHIRSEVNIDRLCRDIGISRFVAQYNYDYESKEQNVDFEEYLSNILLIKNILATLKITEKQFIEYYKLFLQKEKNKNKIDFATELLGAMKYCMDIDEYFNLKDEYNMLYDNLTTTPFLEWLQIREYLIKNSTSPVKLLSRIYHAQLENGNILSVENLFDNLTNKNKEKKL